jgi:hypothetical protein
MKGVEGILDDGNIRDNSHGNWVEVVMGSDLHSTGEGTGEDKEVFHMKEEALHSFLGDMDMNASRYCCPV